jgi:hypothetical protein
MEVNTLAHAELSITVPALATRFLALGNFKRAYCYCLTPSPLSSSVSNTDRMLRAATTGGRNRRGLDPTGKSAELSGDGLSSPFCKNIPVLDLTKSLLYPRCPVPEEGRWPSSRTLGRDAVDAGSAEDESAFLRTEKSCGPDASTPASSWREQSRRRR